VHFHVIPKPHADSDTELEKQGLVIGWPTQGIPKDELTALHGELVAKLGKE
jgi:hypothetical protein